MQWRCPEQDGDGLSAAALHRAAYIGTCAYTNLHVYGWLVIRFLDAIGHYLYLWPDADKDSYRYGSDRLRGRNAGPANDKDMYTFSLHERELYVFRMDTL